MPLSLFGYRPPTIVQDSVGQNAEFAHTFGGRASEFDLIIDNAPMALHLIYRLDLEDPLIPISHSATQMLPLLQCFNYGTECTYEVISDHKVVLKSPVDQEYYFPPWEAPVEFPRLATSFQAISYDPRNADDVMDWKGVFGWDQLADDQLKRALELARERTDLSLSDGPDEDWTYKDIVDCQYYPPFAQSDPGNKCNNPKCDNDRLQVIALQDDVVSKELIWPDPTVQTIWEMCPSCQCITVTNQCT